MSERERVLAMLEEGKISQEEADELLAVLGDLEEGEERLEDLEVEIETSEPQGEAYETKETNSALADISPKDVQWVRINLLSGNINVRMDPTLSEPVEASGKVTFKRKGDDFVTVFPEREAFKTAKRKRSRIPVNLDGFMDGADSVVKGVEKAVDSVVEEVSGWANNIVGFSKRIGDLDIRVPQGYGVVINSKAGNLDVQGVRYLKAHLLAGDISARDIEGVDIIATAGNVNLGLRLTEGQHRIRATAGNVELELHRHSSLMLDATVSVGDIEAEGLTNLDTSASRFIGKSVSAKVGNGDAQLEIDLKAGNLEVTLDE